MSKVTIQGVPINIKKLNEILAFATPKTFGKW